MKFFKRKPKQTPNNPPSNYEGTVISEVFTWEQRDSKGRLIADDKGLKTKMRIIRWLKRKLNNA